MLVIYSDEENVCVCYSILLVKEKTGSSMYCRGKGL